MVATSDSGIGLPSPARINVCGNCVGIEANGIGKPNANGNGAIRQPEIGCQLSPSQLPASCFDTCCAREAVARRGERIDRPRDFGIAALRADDVDDAVDAAERFLDRFRELRRGVRDRRRRSSPRSARHCLRDRRACPAAAGRIRSRRAGTAFVHALTQRR